MNLSRLERSLSFGARGPFHSPDDDSGGGVERQESDDAKPGGKQGEEFQPITTPEALTAYKNDLRRNIAKEVRADLESDFKKRREDQEAADKKKRDDQAAKDRGDFEVVETGLRTDLQKAQDDLKAANDALDRMKEIMKASVDAGWKELPDHVRTLGEKQHGDDDIVGRYEYLNDPTVQEIVKSLSGDKKEAPKGPRKDPPKAPSGETPSIEDTVNDFRKMHGRVSVR
jgi:hypothetical protein